MFDVITFGSATCDLFLQTKSKNGFALGEKVLVDNTEKTTGGGGSNVACGLANFGLKTAYCGKVGYDKEGEAVIADLKRFGVDRGLVKKDKTKPTAFSCVASVFNGERTIFVYQGACHFLTAEELPWSKIRNAKWLYIAPLYKQSKSLLETILSFARNNNIKTAVNLSLEHLEIGKANLKSALAKIDLLILNKQEAQTILSTSISGDEELLEQLQELTQGIVVISKGEAGSAVCYNQSVWQADIIKTQVVDATGAGDAFGAGFLAGLILKNNIEYAIGLATANSSSCISQVGAKNGLLSKKGLVNLPKIKISKTTLYE